jgi:hypothetical protein
LKGVAREIEIPLHFNGVVTYPGGLRAGFTSQFSVDRRNFGIVWDRVFDWGVMAGYELTFTLDIELATPTRPLPRRLDRSAKLGGDREGGSLQVPGHEADLAKTRSRQRAVVDEL